MYSGFVVAIKPYEFQTETFIAKPYPPLRKIYHGIQRALWYRPHSFYLKNPTMKKYRDEYMALTQDGYSYPISVGPSRSIFEIIDFYNKYFDGLNENEEIIAIGGSSLSCLFGEIDMDNEIELLGYDVWVPSYWSLIHDGYCLFPDLFTNVSSQINSLGLLESKSAASDYILCYQELASKKLVESLPTNLNEEIDLIKVGRPKDKTR